MNTKKIAASLFCALIGACLLLFLSYLAIIPITILTYKIFKMIDGDFEEKIYLNFNQFAVLNIFIVLTIYAGISGVSRPVLVETLVSLSDLALLKTSFQREIANMDEIPLPYVRITLLHFLSLMVFAVSLPALFWRIGNYHAACAKIFLKSKKFTRSAIANIYLVSGFLILLFVMFGFLGYGPRSLRYGVGTFGANVVVTIMPSIILGLSSMWFCARLNSLRLDRLEKTASNGAGQPPHKKELNKS